ncbi:MAG: ABC transporter substrate-binding protein [Pseudomonadota bacterium]|nr:ABC transporter substrate-binding protein [Pseudomonadota bacterium]
MRVETTPSRAGVKLTLGFIPLVDCAPLVVARDKGFASREGLSLSLVRESSWANIRDRVMLGHFDAAHMLGPLPIAASLGVGHAPAPMIAPFSLGLGGNAITVSSDLFAQMRRTGADLDAGPRPMAGALAETIRRRRAAGATALTFAVVHAFSSHNYELRYWLAAAGVDPDRDLRIVVTPPPRMVEALREGGVDGFCVGEPWNSLAVEAGLGVIAATKSAIWRHGPEKVLGLRADFAQRAPEALAALLRALYRAAEWVDRPENHDELAQRLAAPDCLDAPAEIVLRALNGRLVRKAGEAAKATPDFLLFNAGAANFPWESHALWLYSQMARWRQIAFSPADVDIVRRVYRPDLYRAALAGAGVDLPRANAKVEGALPTATPVASRLGAMVLGPDGFFDGRLFDPDRIEAYIASFGAAARAPD